MFANDCQCGGQQTRTFISPRWWYSNQLVICDNDLYARIYWLTDREGSAFLTCLQMDTKIEYMHNVHLLTKECDYDKIGKKLEIVTLPNNYNHKRNSNRSELSSRQTTTAITQHGERFSIRERTYSFCN
jgi:hypothetical protein